MRFREVERKFSNQGMMKKEITPSMKIKPRDQDPKLTLDECNDYWKKRFAGIGEYDDDAKEQDKKSDEKYNKISEALQERINSGKITLEFAEMVNDLAYEKYIIEAQNQGYDFKLNKSIDGCEISHYFYSDEKDDKEVKNTIKQELEKSLPVLMKQYSKIKNDIIKKASEDIKDINTNIKPSSVDFSVSGDRHQYELWYKTKGTDSRTTAGEQDIDIEAHVTIIGNKIKKQWSTCHLD